MANSRTCPYESANWLSKATFWWTNALMLKGFRQTLEIEDVYDCVKDHESANLAAKLERNWEKEARRHGNKGVFLRAVIWTFAADILYPGIFMLIMAPIDVLQPYVIGVLISYLEDDNISALSAYLFAASLGLMGVVMSLMDAQYFYTMEFLSMKVKTAVSAVIYRKVVRLSSTSLQRTSSGHIVNLLSSDVDKFQLALESSHLLWHSPLLLSLLMYMMCQEIGLSALLGLVVFVLYFPLQCLVSRMVGKIRLNLALCGDKRIGFMNELIAGMNVVKLYCWERPFGQRINDLRRQEMKHVRATQNVHAFDRGFHSALPGVMGIIIFLSAWRFGVKLTTKRVFTVYAWLSVLGRDENYFVEAFTELAVSMKRVQEFLLMDDQSQNIPDNASTHSCEIVRTESANSGDAVIISSLTTHLATMSESKTSNGHGNTTVVQYKNGSPVQVQEESVFTLNKLDLTVIKGEFIAIVGQVGAGKTSVLMTLLSEIPLVEGFFSVNGNIAYVPQKAWVFCGTIRDNVLFGASFNTNRYQKVLQVCQLLQDIDVMPNRDQTLVGERGLRLSGGQKARVTLARAVYRDADIYLFDDPLSAVDNNVGREIFNRCMCEMLDGKTRILVTHQLQYLELVDQVVVMDQGQITNIDTWRNLKQKGLDMSTFLLDGERKTGRAGATADLEGTVRDVKEDQEREDQEEEERLTGRVNWHVYKSYLKYGKGHILAPLTFLIGIITWGTYSSSDWYLAKWVSSCRTMHSYDDTTTRLSLLLPNSEIEGYTTLASENQNLSTSSGSNFTSASTNYDWLNTDCYITYMYMYVGFYLCHLVSQQIFYHLAFRFCSTASRSLHDTMFSRILRARMRFFDTNPVGRVLNRFARDLGCMDDSLPENIVRYVNITMRLTTLSIVTCIINPWLFLALLPLVGAICLLRYFSVRAMRDMRRLEAVARSPVYSHLSETLNGLTSIRSYKMDSQFVNIFDGLQNTHSIAWFLFLSTYRWFGLRSRMLVVIYVFLAAISSVAVKDSFSGSLFALSLVYVIDFSDPLEYSIRLTSRIENLMTSVERVLSYTSLDTESSASVRRPSENWPAKGELCFKELSLRYGEDLPIVLKNITCDVKHGEKIGIVGRTGAGKSSILVSLFRLVEPSGQIWIDGIDITDIGLYELRRKISIIPQDPVLFNGSLRYNLDPFDEHQDVELWRVLDQVQLKEKIEDTGKLDMVVNEGGTNLSVGQRQLVCLARAMLRGNKILVLDEATANVDNRTDELIQDAIRRRFQDCTVLTVAHRLHTVMDSDRVMVIQNGELKEFDHPYSLLQNPDGYFTKMVDQTGPSQAEALREMAEKYYNNEDAERLGIVQMTTDDSTYVLPDDTECLVTKL